MNHPISNVTGDRVKPIFVVRVELIYIPSAEFGVGLVILIKPKHGLCAAGNHVF
jgi:hypothetical protein